MTICIFIWSHQEKKLPGTLILEIERLYRISIMSLRPSKNQLWQHQQDAIDAIEQSEHNRNFVEIPCGCGKSKIIYRLLKNTIADNDTKVHLLVVPNLLLVDQFSKDYKLADFNWIYTCSGDTFRSKGLHTTDPYKIIEALKLKVAKNPEYKEIEIFEDLEEEYDEDVSLATNCDTKISIPLINTNTDKYEFNDLDKPVFIISTYHSLEVIRSVISMTDLKIDLTLLDEAHHASSPRVSWLYTNKYIDKIVHFTATKIPKNDNLQHGPTIYKYGLREAIENKIVMDYKIYAVLYTTDVYYKNTNESERVKSMIKSIDSFIRTIKNKKILAFNSFNSKSVTSSTNTIEFASEYKKLVSDIVPFTFKTKSSVSKKREVIHKFITNEDQPYNILINCRMLAEGINIPECDGIILPDSSTSDVLIAQRIGRILRFHPNKEIPAIILPIYIHKDEKIEEFNKYSAVIEMIKNINKIDDVLLKVENSQITQRIMIHNYNFINDPNISQLIMNRIVETIESKKVKPTFEKYIKFYNDNKRLPKDSDRSKEENALADWMQKHKKNYHKDCEDPNFKRSLTLTFEQIKILEALPKFSWGRNDDWNANYRLVALYYEENGSYPPTEIVINGIIEKNPLHTWVAVQKRRRNPPKTSRSAPLSDFEIKLLEKLPNWTWCKNEEWMYKYFGVIKFILTSNAPIRQVKICPINSNEPFGLYKFIYGIDKGKTSNPERIYLHSLFVKLRNDPVNKTIYLYLMNQYCDRNNLPFLLDIDLPKIDLNKIKDEDKGYEFDTEHGIKTRKTKIIEKISKIPLNKIPIITKDNSNHTQVVLPKIINKSSSTKRDVSQQSEFRLQTLNRYENVCIISGCSIQLLLEAAHIIPYTKHKEYENINIENALLLRQDIHTLYDEFLFSVSPDGTIHMSKELKETSYERMLTKNKIEVIFTTLEKMHLQWHYDSFVQIEKSRITEK